LFFSSSAADRGAEGLSVVGLVLVNALIGAEVTPVDKLTDDDVARAPVDRDVDELGHQDELIRIS